MKQRDGMSQNEELFGKEYFDAGRREPGVYAGYSRKHWHPEFKALATQIRARFKPATVLDVGCAKGFLVQAFREVGIEAYGVDISDYAISCAPPEIRPYLYKVDLNKDALPFGDKKFDFVTFLGTIECLSSHQLVMQEVARILRTGGYIYLTTFFRASPKGKILINIHGKAFWVREFERHGLKYMPREAAALEKARLAYMLRNPEGKGTVKSRLGRLIYDKGGYLGKELALLGSKFAGNPGHLLFIKQSK
jgi:SAM-dependent methyltransferase